nr:MAG TPA: hypothetical protein [Caudoviricetes sp.]
MPKLRFAFIWFSDFGVNKLEKIELKPFSLS